MASTKPREGMNAYLKLTKGELFHTAWSAFVKDVSPKATLDDEFSIQEFIKYCRAEMRKWR